MTLDQALITTKPREIDGSRVDERYYYQKDVSLFTMVELYNKMDDFVCLFDFHDDLVIINSESKPSEIYFYQIKTKSKGYWTVPLLIKSEKTQSFLSKLYSNKVTFKDFKSSINFISNARYNFKLNSGEYSESKFEINGTDLNKVDIDKINNNIKNELNLEYNPEFENSTNFKVSKLSLNDSKTHCKGALCELLEELNPGNFPNINLTYNKILNEIRVKTDTVLSDYSIKNLNDAIEKKGISKQVFTRLLIAACPYKSIDEEWRQLEDKLLHCNIGYITTRKIKDKFREISIISVHSPNDIPLSKTFEYIKNITSMTSSSTNPELNELNIYETAIYIQSICNEDLPYKHFDHDFIKVLILKYLNNE
ncbi:dsDNA nuclease domain-containing protein [Larkinella punicea]|nr:dsDNA nuclease domain-containing protein [Larkinella punicea]